MGAAAVQATTEIRALAQILDELDYYSVLEIAPDAPVPGRGPARELLRAVDAASVVRQSEVPA